MESHSNHCFSKSTSLGGLHLFAKECSKGGSCVELSNHTFALKNFFFYLYVDILSRYKRFILGGGRGGTFIVYQIVILDTALIWHLKSEKSKIKLALFHFNQENNAYLNWCYTILYLFLFKFTLKVQDVLKSKPRIVIMC